MKNTTLVFVLLLTTIVLWLIAMTTPGWSVHSNRPDEEVHVGVFYVKFCTQQKCTYPSHYEYSKGLKVEQALGPVIAFQIENLLVFILYGISCILVMLPDSCSCNKKCIRSIVMILLVIADTIALMIIFEMCFANEFGSIFALAGLSYYFPYSIFFAVASLVIGIYATVYNYVVLRSLINRNAVNDQYFGLAPRDQQDYNQVIENNFRRPNEANQNLSQNTDNMAANYQNLGLVSEEPHVYDKIPLDKVQMM